MLVEQTRLQTHLLCIKYKNDQHDWACIFYADRGQSSRVGKQFVCTSDYISCTLQPRCWSRNPGDSNTGKASYLFLKSRTCIISIRLFWCQHIFHCCVLCGDFNDKLYMGTLWTVAHSSRSMQQFKSASICARRLCDLPKHIMTSAKQQQDTRYLGEWMMEGLPLLLRSTIQQQDFESATPIFTHLKRM